MERTVPSTASEEVELYLRTYYSLLRSTADVQIRSLEEVHAGMHSLLHPDAREPASDMTAFVYSLLRLPTCIHRVQRVLLGQSPDVFRAGGYPAVESWEPVSAPARRRRCFYDGNQTLACFIASRTDIDDVVPMLTAYQIEWNKLYEQVNHNLSSFNNLDLDYLDEKATRALSDILGLSLDDLAQLKAVWKNDFSTNLRRIAVQKCDLRVLLLNGSLTEYRRATNDWWENIERIIPEVRQRPIYFVSSNTHSLINLLSGFAMRRKNDLIAFLHRPENGALLKEWEDIETDEILASQENFLYYMLKKYQSSSVGWSTLIQQRDEEKNLGITRVPSEHSFDVEAQLIEFRSLNPDWIDPRLVEGDLTFLAESDAYILNIDYPLGLSAYNLLSEIAAQVGKILGVYVMGKAAGLNSAIGDVVIPNVVHDEHSQNTYLIENCFVAAHIAPNLCFGTVLDNQKSVTVRGTFLQNAHYMDVFYREGYTDIEMEAGAYLSAVYEMYRPKRHPTNEIVNLYGIPFDLGIVHYISDTPLSKGRNLGAANLSYFGMDATYAASIAVLKRILQIERFRCMEK